MGDKTMAVKFADGSDTIIEGYGVPFGLDLDGQRFEADTNRCHDWFPNGGRPFLYDHGFHKATKMEPVGRELTTTPDEIGDFVRGELDRANKYYDAVAQLVREGKLGFSSGAPDHKVKIADDGKIELWPVVEYSLTPMPSFPNKVAYAMKSALAIEHLTAVDAAIPAPLNELVEHGTVRLSIDAEQEAGPVPDLPERIEAVSVDVRAYLDQTVKHAQVRAKAGRVLSKANRQRLAQHLTLIEELRKDLAELYEATDPERESRAKAATDAYYRTLAATYGAQVNPEVPT